MGRDSKGKSLELQRKETHSRKKKGKKARRDGSHKKFWGGERKKNREEWMTKNTGKP